jgi:hypothetical protein
MGIVFRTQPGGKEFESLSKDLKNNVRFVFESPSSQ